jgi:hypothetical protein
MHMARHMGKTLISSSVEMSVFCLLRCCLNPRRTQNCVLETLEESSGCAILQIALKVVCYTLQHKTLLNFTKDNGKIGVKYC